MRNLRAGIVLVLSLALLAPALTTAQEGSVTFVLMYKAKPGKGTALVDLIKSHWQGSTDAQIAAGNVRGWGIAEAANYQGGFTHLEWLNYPSWEAADKAEAAWEKEWEAKSRADKDAYRRGMQDLLTERVYNRVNSSVIRKLSDTAESPRYIVLGEFNANPGKATAGTELYQELAVPIYDSLLADGAIGGYGLAVPAMHDGDWTHWTWFSVDSLSGIGKVHEKLGSITGSDFDGRLAATFDMSTHRDTIYRILHISENN